MHSSSSLGAEDRDPLSSPSPRSLSHAVHSLTLVQKPIRGWKIVLGNKWGSERNTLIWGREGRSCGFLTHALDWMVEGQEGRSGDRSVQHGPTKAPGAATCLSPSGSQTRARLDLAPRKVAQKMAPLLGSVSAVPGSRGITASGPGPLSPGDRWRSFPGRGRGRRPGRGRPPHPAGRPPQPRDQPERRAPASPVRSSPAAAGRAAAGRERALIGPRGFQQANGVPPARQPRPGWAGGAGAGGISLLPGIPGVEPSGSGTWVALPAVRLGASVGFLPSSPSVCVEPSGAVSPASWRGGVRSRRVCLRRVELGVQIGLALPGSLNVGAWPGMNDA